MIARVCITVLLCLQVASAGVTRWQPATHFRVNTLYLPMGGIGVAVDRDVSRHDAVGMSAGFMNLSLKDPVSGKRKVVNYQGVGLRWTRLSGSVRDTWKGYAHGTAGLGHLGFRRSDGTTGGGPLYWVQGMVGLENTGWMSMRVRSGVGLAHAWPDDPEGNQPWLDDLIRGTNLRVEFTLEFVKVGKRTQSKPWQPRTKMIPGLPPRP